MTALEIAQARAAQAQENRLRFPFTTGIVDDLRAHGFDARVKHAREGQAEIGRESDPGVQASDSSRYIDDQTRKRIHERNRRSR